jgi:hypothetical protein
MTQVALEILPCIKWAYGPNEFCKRDPHRTAFITEATSKTCPGIFPDVFGINSLFNGIFCDKTRGKIPVHLGQGAGSSTFAAFNAMKDLKFFYKLV